MKSDDTHLDRRSYLKTAGVATAGMIGLAGCSATEDGGDGSGSDGGGQQQYGTLSTAVTDQPNDIGDFEELIVTIDGIWVKPAGEEGDDENGDETESDGEDEDQTETSADSTETPANGTETPADGTETETDSEATESGGEDDETETSDEDDGTDEEAEEEAEDGEGSGRRYIEFEEAQQADLVELQGSETQLVDETEVETGEYQFLQLDVSDTTGTLAESGEEANVETPGNAPLKFNKSFEIRAEERTRFIADFAPHQTGQGKYIIRPVATGTTVLYGDEEYDPESGGESTGDGQDGGEFGNTGNPGDDGKSGDRGKPDNDGESGGDGGGDETADTATPTPSDD